LDHTQRGKCAEYKAALDSGVIVYNDKGRFKVMATGEELPLMYGKGAVKVLVPNKMHSVGSGISSSVTAVADVGAITFDDDEYGSLGSSVRVAALEGQGWVDVDVEEKRKGNFSEPRCRLRP